MRFVTLLISTFFAFESFAVAPQFWRVRTAEDFLGGEIDGFAVTSRGELRPGPAVRKVVSFPDPFVFAQVTGENGDRYFGTGNEGKVYRLRGTELKPIFSAGEQEIYALAWHRGSLYAASSPNGKVYRINPADGASSVFFDPKQAYIWAIQFTPNGELLVATGVDGKLFRVDAKGEGKLIFTAPETHIRSLALRKDGSVLAGGSGKGRIYKVTSDGTGHALWDSPLTEISAIHLDPNGIAWAAGATGALPAAAPPPKTQPAKQASQSGTAEQKKEEGATPTAEVTVTFEESTSTTGSASNGELYRIDTDDFVETERKFEREMIYAIADGPGGGIALATGPQGRIYSYREGEISLLGTVPEKQIVSVISSGGAMTVTTTNSGAVYRLDAAPSARAEFRSAVKDAERFSRFGQYRLEGTALAESQTAISFRSGNTRTPDATWSPWSQPVAGMEGQIQAPPARYIQWKVTMPRPTGTAVLDTVTVAFINRNVAPVIDTVSVAEPAVIFVTGAYPASPQVVEATNPDEYGIFTSLEPARDRNDPGKRAFRKGYRTVTWRVRDENGDTLRYSVFFRRVGSEPWLRLRERIEESQINFDTSQLPDGEYEIRLTATDEPDNPERPLMDTKEGLTFQVDNTAPSVTVTQSSGANVNVRVTDTASPVGRVEYSIDAEKWIRLIPDDGIADSSNETYTLPRKEVDGKFVIVRAVDSFYNVATANVSVR